MSSRCGFLMMTLVGVIWSSTDGQREIYISNRSTAGPQDWFF